MVDRSWSLLFYFVVLFFLSFPLSYAGALLAEYGDSFLEKDKAGGLRIAGRLLLLTEHRERTTAVLRTGLTISISLEFILLSAAFFSLPQRLAAYFGAEGGVLFLLRAGCYLLLLAVFGGLHLLVGEFIPAMLGQAARRIRPSLQGRVAAAAVQCRIRSVLQGLFRLRAGDPVPHGIQGAENTRRHRGGDPRSCGPRGGKRRHRTRRKGNDR